MAVPYTFATASTTLPLSQLDANFQTPITIGQTNANLGQVVLTITGLTLANVTIASGNVTVNNVTGNATITGGTINNVSTYNETLNNVTVSSVNTTFPNNFLSNSTTTLGNAVLTLGGSTSTVSNLSLNNVTINSGSSNVTQNLANVTGTLAVSNGGTGLISLTAGYIPYGNGTSTFSSSSGLTYQGSALAIGSYSAGYGALQVRGGFAYVNEDGADTHQLYLRSFLNSAGPAIQVVSNDPLLFTTNNTERMRIDSSGNVGIGTSSPSTKLDVNGSVTVVSTGAVQFGTGFTNYISGNATSQFMQFYTNSTERMRIDSSGNVGIGTSSPASYGGFKTLTLNGSIGGLIQLQSNGTNTGRFYAPSATNTVIDTVAGDLTVYATGSLFWGTGNATKATLDSSGNLGLGVTPSAWATYKAMQVGWSSLAGYAGTDTAIFCNAYFDGGYKYIGTGFASQYCQINSSHQWFTAPSRTAGTAITFTQAMTLDASGNLTLTGPNTNYSPNYKFGMYKASSNVGLLVNCDSGYNAYLNFSSYAGKNSFGYNYGSSQFQWCGGNDGLGTGVQMVLDSSGNLLVGTTSTSGSSSNTASAVSGIFRSYTASVNASNATATTITTLTTGINACYLVNINVNGVTNDATNYSAFATIITNGTTARIANFSNGTLCLITLSGLNVQVTQSSGSTQTCNATLTRIA